MGYDVHITRKEDWADPDGPAISLEEWLAVVAADPEMRLDGYAEAHRDGSVLRMECEGLAVWTAYSGHGLNGNMAWFLFNDDRIVVRNPDNEILRKMWTLARALSARVQGDDGEFYDAEGNGADEDG
jgi:hypothetical protein